jgi:hypothetical protein
MTIRWLRLRLRDCGRHMRQRAYACLAALFSGPPRPGEEVAAGRLFRRLVDWEAAEGTPLDTVLGRLPPGLVQAIRREFRPSSRRREPAPSRRRAGDSGRGRRRESIHGPRRLAAGSTRHPDEALFKRKREGHV